LGQSNNRLIESQPGFKANGQEVESIRQAQANFVSTSVRRPSKPKIRQKETNSNRDEKKSITLLLRKSATRMQRVAGTASREPRKMSCVSWPSKTGQHQPANKLRVRFWCKQLSDQRERLRKKIDVQC
jgi:hypothetical protein